MFDCTLLIGGEKEGVVPFCLCRWAWTGVVGVPGVRSLRARVAAAIPFSAGTAMLRPVKALSLML